MPQSFTSHFLHGCPQGVLGHAATIASVRTVVRPRFVQRRTTISSEDMAQALHANASVVAAQSRSIIATILDSHRSHLPVTNRRTEEMP